MANSSPKFAWAFHEERRVGHVAELRSTSRSIPATRDDRTHQTGYHAGRHSASRRCPGVHLERPRERARTGEIRRASGGDSRPSDIHLRRRKSRRRGLAWQHPEAEHASGQPRRIRRLRTHRREPDIQGAHRADPQAARRGGWRRRRRRRSGKSTRCHRQIRSRGARGGSPARWHRRRA